MQQARGIRWRSPLGISSILFLVSGLAAVGFAVYVPAVLHAGGPGAARGVLVLGENSDSQLLGRSLADLGKADARLGTYLVTFMDTMCQQMMMYGIMQVAVAWYGIKSGQAWALWSSAIALLSSFVYLLVIGKAFISAGVPAESVRADTIIALVPLAAILVIATSLGAFGLRRARMAEQF